MNLICPPPIRTLWLYPCILLVVCIISFLFTRHWISIFTIFMFYVAIIVDREHDLLKAINVPFDDPKTMYFDQGLDGFPAFGIMPGSDIKSPYRLTLPERFYPEFSVVCTVAVKSAPGGFIFAVLNPSETVCTSIFMHLCIN